MRPLALLALLALTPEPQHFQYTRAVLRPPTAGQACLPLDATVFAHSSPHLADLRLFRNSTEVPFALKADAAPTPTAPAPVPLLNLGQRGPNIAFDAHLPRQTYSDLTLAIAAHDFIASVTVTGSPSPTAGPQTRLGTFTVFDLTRQHLGRSTVLHLPPSNLPYLHFLLRGPLTPADLSSLTVEAPQPNKPLFQPVAETSATTTEDHTSTLTLTVPAHVPVDRLVFLPAPEPTSFSRAVHVEVQPLATAGDAEPTQLDGTLLRLHTVEDGHALDEEHLTLSTSALDLDTPARWTIRISNGDDPPLPTAVRLEMLQRSLCFQAAANATYTLLNGDPALPAPVYDYAALFSRQAGTPAPATLGPEQPNPAFQPRPDLRPFTERHPALLWSALLAVLALLGCIALRSARPQAHTPSPPNAP